MANKTTHYEVFDYWKDKSIDKHGTCYTGDNIDFHNTIPIVKDWGEPECYACGCSAIDYSHMEDDERYDKALKEDDGLKYIYSRKDIKKCTCKQCMSIVANIAYKNKTTLKFKGESKK